MFNRFYHMCDQLPIKTLILDMKQAFFELPTEDVKPVVRCKDCVHIKPTEYGGFCWARDEGVAYSDTCPFAEARHDD